MTDTANKATLTTVLAFLLVVTLSRSSYADRTLEYGHPYHTLECTPSLCPEMRKLSEISGTFPEDYVIDAPSTSWWLQLKPAPKRVDVGDTMTLTLDGDRFRVLRNESDTEIVVVRVKAND